MSGKSKNELDDELKQELEKSDSRADRIELLLIQILRELKKNK